MLGLAVLLSSETAWPGSFPRIPPQTLSGSRFLIPDDLGGDVNVMVIGFTEKTGSNNRPWIERLENGFGRESGVAIYPVAVLAGVPAPFLFFALGSIRGSTAPEKRDRFLIVDRPVFSRRKATRTQQQSFDPMEASWEMRNPPSSISSGAWTA